MSAENYHLQRIDRKEADEGRKQFTRWLRGTPNVFLHEQEDGQWKLWRYKEGGGAIISDLGDIMKHIQHFDDCEALYEAAFEVWLEIVCEMFGFKMNYVHLEMIWNDSE